MRWRALTAVLVVLTVALASPTGPRADDGPALLTVAGAVAHPNRDAVDGFRDAFFGYHEIAFDRARAFDHAALAALPQATVTARAEGWPAGLAVRATGPRLADVLAAAGVDGAATITAVALDGYAVEITAEVRAAHDWIIAIVADGRPLGVGGRGPAWLLYDSGGGEVSEEEEARWVWSMFLITTE